MAQRLLYTDRVLGYATKAGHGNIGTANDQHLVVGLGAADGYYYRNLLRFALDWTDVAKITSAYIVVRTKDRTSHIGTQAGYVKAVLVSGAITDIDTGGESYNYDDNAWGAMPAVNADYTSPRVAINTAEDGATRINVTTALGLLAPKTVKRADGSAGGGLSVRGWRLDRDSTGRLIAASDKHPDVPSRPYLELNYTETPAPGSMTQDGPISPITQIEGEEFTGDFIAGRFGDHMARLQIEVYPEGGGTPLWTYDAPASASEAVTDHYSVSVPALLRSGTSYEWRVRSLNQRGDWSPWTGKVDLVVTTEAPVITAATPVAGSYATLDNVFFGGHYEDANANPLSYYRIQVRSDTTPGDPNWDSVEMLWDTGDVSATQIETNPASGSDIRTDLNGYLPLDNGGIIQRLYGGVGLGPGTYDYRVRATDSLGATSLWVYGTFTLTVGYTPAPGESANDLTAYSIRQVRARVIIRDMGANRGPGNVVAIIEDSANVGCSEMYNDAGELFFTLPAIHPQVSVIEPWQVHWHYEEFTGQGWKEMNAGLITEMDATEDDVVFYGLDYMGVLDDEVDERFNPDTSPDSAAGIYPAAPGGAKYVNQTIRNVVYDQLQRARTMPNSKVGFIAVDLAKIAVMDERIGIFATFKQRMSFIAGLLDSHKAGTGKRTRLSVRRTISGTYEWRVDDNPGFDRDNIRMEYGGLVQGFRAVPFGEFGTRVNAIGRQFNGLKVHYYVAPTPPPTGEASNYNETIYGRTSKSRMWQDITDKNDLIRRARQYARTLGKIGKQLALAIRVDSLGVKDGWDICDSIPVVIKRGVVDTTRWGSTYYTIWGWTRRFYPDGHTDLTLSILPREDSVAASTDLIASKPINVAKEWEVGYTPPPIDATALHWLDQTNGAVYDRVGGEVIVTGATGTV